MSNESKPLKPFAQTEREKIRERFKARASNPPVNAQPWSREWAEYVREMQDLEQQLRMAGEVL